MRKLFAVVVALVVSAGPAFAQGDLPWQDCGPADPETTGSLPSDPRSLFMPGEHPTVADTDPPEASWQDEARESSEERWRDLLDCGVN
ncbi:hypothetical protein [Methylobacterium sp. J-067]|jgi:hypothetical protein|uniref:hypothetical protein n=1 Tax=Methylobacterium sp. J-067 TaxID=2836648 RepID=UPI001FBAB41A|nr:hypothetical protein [Methylobacterium sp. J-067]MCJ2025185.1 hypothetical protein [Methylobacterium sp. J-067]